ncbi:MAG: HesA/MoeB/ThiF family protein [Candidatus Ranarchaeia archaeon]
MTIKEDKSTYERYSRQIVLKNIGLKGHNKIRKSHVTIVGMGGLGSASTAPLTGMGIGTLRIIDQDIVSLSNLQRQLLYKTADVGLPKVEAAMNTIQKMNPQVKVEPFSETIQKSTAIELLSGTDIVIDGLDSFTPRFIVNQACVELGIPYVFAGALETYGNLTTIIPKKTACLECIFPGVQQDSQLTCEQVGVLPTILGVVGGIQANEAIMYLTGQNPALMNKLLFIDLNYGGFELVNLHRQKTCSVCGGKTSKKPLSKIRKGNKSSSGTVVMNEPTLLCGGTLLITSNLGRQFDKLENWVDLLKPHISDLSVSELGMQGTIEGYPVRILRSGNIIIEKIKKKDRASSIAKKIERWSTKK